MDGGSVVLGPPISLAKSPAEKDGGYGLEARGSSAIQPHPLRGRRFQAYALARGSITCMTSPPELARSNHSIPTPAVNDLPSSSPRLKRNTITMSTHSQNSTPRAPPTDMLGDQAAGHDSSDTLHSADLAVASFPLPPTITPTPSTHRAVSPSISLRSPYSALPGTTFQGRSAPGTPRGSKSIQHEEGHSRLRSQVSMDAIRPTHRPSMDTMRYAHSIREQASSYAGSPRMPFGTPVLSDDTHLLDAGPSRPHTPSLMEISRLPRDIFDPSAEDADDEDDEHTHATPKQGVAWDVPQVDGVLRSAPGVYGIGEGWAGGPQPKARKRWFRRKKRIVTQPTVEDPLALWQEPVGAREEKSAGLKAVWNRSKAAFASVPSLLPSSPKPAGEQSPKRGKLSNVVAGWSKSRLSLSKPIAEEDGPEAHSPKPHYRKASDVRAEASSPESPVVPPATATRRSRWSLVSPSMPHLGLARKPKDTTVVTRRVDHMPGPIPPRNQSLHDLSSTSPTLSIASSKPMSPIMAHYLANASAPTLAGTPGWKSITLASALGMPQVLEVDETQGGARMPSPPTIPSSISHDDHDRMSAATFGARTPSERPPLPRTGTFGSRAASQQENSGLSPNISPTAMPVATVPAVDQRFMDVPTPESEGPQITPLRESAIGLDTLASMAEEVSHSPVQPVPKKRPSLQALRSAFSSFKSWSRGGSLRSASSERPESSAAASPPRPATSVGIYKGPVSAPVFQPETDFAPAAKISPVRAQTLHARTDETERAERRSSWMFNMPQANGSTPTWLRRLSKLTEDDDASRSANSAADAATPDPFHRVYANQNAALFKSMTALNEVDIGAGSFNVDDILDNRRRKAIVKRMSLADLSTTITSPAALARYRKSEYDIPESTALHSRNVSLPSSIANSTSSGSSVLRTPAVGRTVYLDQGESSSSVEVIPRGLPCPPRPRSTIQKNMIHSMESAQSSDLSIISMQEVICQLDDDAESLVEEDLEGTVPSHAKKGSIASMSKVASYVSLECLAAVH